MATPDNVGYPLCADVAVSTKIASGTALEGALFYCFEDQTFNTLLVEITAITASGTMCLAMYQFATGEMNDGTSLVPQIMLIQNQALTTTPAVNPITVPSTSIKRGFYYVLVGRDGGTSFTFRGHSGLTILPWTSPATSPAFPLLFTYGTPGSPPATLDLSSVVGSVGNQSIVHRRLQV